MPGCPDKPCPSLDAAAACLAANTPSSPAAHHTVHICNGHMVLWWVQKQTSSSVPPGWWVGSVDPVLGRRSRTRNEKSQLECFTLQRILSSCEMYLKYGKEPAWPSHHKWTLCSVFLFLFLPTMSVHCAWHWPTGILGALLKEEAKFFGTRFLGGFKYKHGS